MRALDILYPPRCPFCGGITDQGICPSCREQIRPIQEPRCVKCGKPVPAAEQEYCRDCQRQRFSFDQGRSLWLHTKTVPRAIYQFKFHNKRYYAGIFAKEMAEEFGGWIRRRKIEEIIPIPLHSSKRRARGFNQAELVAEHLGGLTGIPVNKNVLFRARKTQPQKKLGHRERQENLKGAFGVSSGWDPCKNVLVVDDIYTTGNTVHRAARILKKAGAEKVFFLTISIGQGL